MSTTIGLIVLVIVVSGALGGVMNSFLSAESNDAKMPTWKHVVIGVGAALIIPLFLNSISANLINEIIGIIKDGKAENPDYSKLLVLTGFCILSAVVSKRFISTLSDKIFDLIAKNERDIKAVGSKTEAVAIDAQAAKDAANRAEMVVAPLIEEDEGSSEISNLNEYAGPAALAENERSVPIDISLNLTEDERAVLASAINGVYSMRTFTGLYKDSKLAKNRTNDAITSLMQKGLFDQVIGKKNQILWYATSKGRVAFKK